MEPKNVWTEPQTRNTSYNPTGRNMIVENLTRCKVPGQLKGFADVVLPNGIKLRRCRIIQQQGQRLYVAMPQTEWQDAFGKTRYCELVSLPPDLRAEVQNAILAECLKRTTSQTAREQIALAHKNTQSYGTTTGGGDEQPQ